VTSFDEIYETIENERERILTCIDVVKETGGPMKLVNRMNRAQNALALAMANINEVSAMMKDKKCTAISTV
jgi:hypothetical protein